MSRWINADEFLADESEAYMNAQIKLAKENADKTIDATRYINQVVHKKIQMLISDTPSIDLVRCKECRHWHKSTEFCDKFSFGGYVAQRMTADDYCSCGEREGE